MDKTATILVVDDHEEIQFYTEHVLADAGYQVLVAGDGLEALDVLSSSESVDLILADIAMPRMNGYQLYEEIVNHPQWVAIPLVFLTARAMDSDIRFGKELGVDDYITNPFNPDDLISVVRSRLRRAQQLAEVVGLGAVERTICGTDFSFGDLHIDVNRHCVWFRRRQVRLSAHEFTLLVTLAQRVDCVVPLEEIVQATHNIHTDFQDAGTLLRPLIRSLRRKLGYRTGEMGCIKNVRGVGYKLVAEVPEEERLNGVLYPLRASQF